MTHTLVTVGWLGGKRAYLDVSREEAVRRWRESEPGSRAEDAHVDEFQFEDEFFVYEASGP